MQPSLFFYSYGSKPQSCHLILNINKQVFYVVFSLILVLHRLFQGIGGNGFSSHFSKSCSSAFSFCLSIASVDLANLLSVFIILTGWMFWK